MPARAVLTWGNIATSNSNVNPLPGRAHGTATRCTLCSGHAPRHPRRHEGLMLEGVQMPPGLLRRVMHRARRLGASRLGAAEPGAPREVQPKIESTSLLVELHRGHPPRLGQTQRRPEHLVQIQSSPSNKPTVPIDRPATPPEPVAEWPKIN